MAFTQIIEAQTDDVEALQRHVSDWHADQYGEAPGYRQARILADADRPGTYLIEVEFTSQEEAKKNNERPQTERWAQRARELLKAEPIYRNLNQVCSTEGS